MDGGGKFPAVVKVAHDHMKLDSVDELGVIEAKHISEVDSRNCHLLSRDVGGSCELGHKVRGVDWLVNGD